MKRRTMLEKNLVWSPILTGDKNPEADHELGPESTAESETCLRPNLFDFSDERIQQPVDPSKTRTDS